MSELQIVKIDKLVHGGQGLGKLPDGRKVFVWNALPNETVSVRLTKKRRDYAEGVAEDIIEPSIDRIKPVDESYLSTSPWQVMNFAAENKYKSEILKETFQREGLDLPEFDFVTAGEEFHYRNKMEYSFWADDLGLSLALFNRGSHGKRTIKGSSIARPEIDAAASKILDVLNKAKIRGSQLKTVMLRVNKTGQVAAAIFVKDQAFPKLDFTDCCQGVVVYYSNPKSPASIITSELYSQGQTQLTDQILDVNLSYRVTSFFQVNLPIFEKALQKIKNNLAVPKDKIIDMYSGVGTIGLAVNAQVLVEVDPQNIAMAKQNAAGQARVIEASTEQALEHITSDSTLIFDPPRAGLHAKVVEKLLDTLPPKIIYLSCNPSTQARDVSLLSKKYKIKTFEGYNFFPRTPHIESLAILERR